MKAEPPDQQLLEAEWDYLIVLDACRYDVFADIYEEYFEGTVEKRRSPGSATPEWAAKTFTGSHDITYLSAIPFVNSLGIPLSELKWGGSCDYDWTATDHIADVVDLWHEEWDDDIGAIRPGAVTDAALDARANGHDRERMVVHYLQPHAPYLRRGRGRKLKRIRGGILEPAADGGGRRFFGDGGSDLPFVDGVRNRVERALGGSELAMALGMLVELDPASILKVGSKGFRETILSYYRENVHLAMEAAAELAEELEGRVVVTADHGEAFGEQNVWEHHVETHIPPLVEVPWLVLE